MYYFTSLRGIRYQDRNLSEVRRKSLGFLRRMKDYNVVDIKSDQQGYMGNVYKTDDGLFVWNPANGKRLAYPDQTYLGFSQHYVNEDGSLGEQIENPIIPFNVIRYK